MMYTPNDQPEEQRTNVPPLDGAARISIERHRQVTEEGYEADHDRGQADALMSAARCYIDAAQLPLGRYDTPEGWPWHEAYWKPSDDHVRNLVIAGALVAAAIDSATESRDAQHAAALAVERQALAAEADRRIAAADPDGTNRLVAAQAGLPVAEPAVDHVVRAPLHDTAGHVNHRATSAATGIPLDEVDRQIADGRREAAPQVSPSDIPKVGF